MFDNVINKFSLIHYFSYGLLSPLSSFAYYRVLSFISIVLEITNDRIQFYLLWKSCSYASSYSTILQAAIFTNQLILSSSHLWVRWYWTHQLLLSHFIHSQNVPHRRKRSTLINLWTKQLWDALLVYLD